MTPAVLLIAGILSLRHQISPLMMEQDDQVCPAEYSYSECVDRGYFNQFGSGQNGGGGTGGYCQNMKLSIVNTYVSCTDGKTYKCPNNACYNAPGSNTYCGFAQTAGCCPDGSHEGQTYDVSACQ